MAEAVPIHSNEWPAQAARPANSRLNCSKLARDFGFKAPRWQCSLRNVVLRLVSAMENATACEDFSIFRHFPKSRVLLAAAAVALAGVAFHFGIISDEPLSDRRYVRGYDDLVLSAARSPPLRWLLFRHSSVRPGAIMGLAAFAALLESAQLPINSRTASWIDLAASIFGIGLGRLTLILGSALSTNVGR